MREALWKPSAARQRQSNLTLWMEDLKQSHDLEFKDYWELHKWSVENPADFWELLWSTCNIQASQPYEQVIVNQEDMLNTKWFQGARLNFAENLLRKRDDSPAIIFCNEKGEERTISYADLTNEVAQIADAMKAMGVEAGDRVAGYLPNLAETVIAMLAATSLGAIWSSTSPDFGKQGVIDRFGQIKPKLLFAADGYYYKSKVIDTLSLLPEITDQIPSIEKIVVIPYVSDASDLSALPKAERWADFAVSNPKPLTFAQLPFDHPLYILYSSGTTGVPKCIVHGAGGTLLQHIKEHRFHVDLKEGDTFFYFTTCGWMMWNWLVSGLASGAALLLFDGSPFYPGPGILWDLAEKYKVKIFGTSAKYLAALEKAGYLPKQEVELSSLETILSTGSPLSAASFEYVYRDIKKDVHLASISGGTDLISCFVLGNPLLPVYLEEIQCAGLGMDVQAFGDDAKPVYQEKGELVCTTPFPCQPIYFWDDPGKDRYRGSYFDIYPNVWRHGDFVEFTERNGIIIYGRSDATLNPGGVRIGTAEIYRSIETMPEIIDSLIVGRDTADKDVEIILFTKLSEGTTFDDDFARQIKQNIRQKNTPRHVPAHIFAVPDIPYTISGKKVELAVRRIMNGQDVPNRDALANPDVLDYYVEVASGL